MTPLFIQVVLAVVLILLGIGLMVWSYVNPKWQRADAYDSVAPFAIGSICLIAGWVWGIALGIFYMVSGG